MPIPVQASLYGGPILSDVQFRTERYGESDVFITHHLPKLKKGGVNALFVPAETMREAELFLREVQRSKGQLELATTSAEVEAVVNRGSCACILAASYSTLGDRLDSLPMLYQLGVRLFTMSGNRRNYFVDGCTERGAGGLSHLGVDLVKQLEELGIIIDVSHTSANGVADIFDVTSKAMVVASHSNTRQICDTVRNVSADQIKAIASRGGMVGVSIHPTLVLAEGEPTVKDVANHMKTIAELVGVDFIGLGTDFVDYAEDVFHHKIKAIDPTGKLYGGVLHSYPKDVETVAEVGNIFSELDTMGFDAQSLAKMRGANIMRVLGNLS